MNIPESLSQKTPAQHIDTHPNPARFAIYNILPGEYGFTIPNCDFVFEFDRHGGWFDEYGNYYNANGESADVPVEYEDDLQDDRGNEYYENEIDNYENRENPSDEKEDVPLEFYDNQYLNEDNQKVLQKYQKRDDINVELHNLSSHWHEESFERFLVDNNIKWIRFKFEYDSKDQFTGTCYIDLDETNAAKLVELNGYKVLGKNLNILVIEPRQLKNNHEPEPSKKNGHDSSTLQKPKEEAKTLENDKDEPTLKRPYPQGKPTPSTLNLEKTEKQGTQYQEKSSECVGLIRNGEIKDGK